jgi:hypothetical protein
MRLVVQGLELPLTVSDDFFGRLALLTARLAKILTCHRVYVPEPT